MHADARRYSERLFLPGNNRRASACIGGSKGRSSQEKLRYSVRLPCVPLQSPQGPAKQHRLHDGPLQRQQFLRELHGHSYGTNAVPIRAAPSMTFPETRQMPAQAVPHAPTLQRTFSSAERPLEPPMHKWPCARRLLPGRNSRLPCRRASACIGGSEVS